MKRFNDNKDSEAEKLRRGSNKRVIRQNDGWYFLSREKKNIGPFETMRRAELGVYFHIQSQLSA